MPEPKTVTAPIPAVAHVVEQYPVPRVRRRFLGAEGWFWVATGLVGVGGNAVLLVWLLTALRS